MNIQKFTQKSVEAINDCEKLAYEYGNQEIEQEHLLVALLRQEDGLIPKLIEKMEIQKEHFVDNAERHLAARVKVSGGQVYVGQDLNKVLVHAEDEAKAMGDEYVSVEHLFLCLIKYPNKAMKEIFKEYGITRERFLQALSTVRGNQRVVSDNPEATYDTLEKYGYDMVERARNQKLDPVIGRDAEIRNVVRILSRKTKNNPVLIGEPGVGKTAVVEGLARKIIEEDIPEILHNKRVLTLDLAGMVAGSKYRGEFEERIKRSLKEVMQSGNILLFIDEIHTIIGAGGAEGAIDAANILKPSLARGELQLIGATTREEYRKYIEKDAALERRFQSVVVEEPTEEEAIKILRGLAPRYEEHHHVKLTDGAVTGAVRLAARYVNDRFLPDKAIDAIDEACARAGLKRYMISPELRGLEEEQVQLEKEKEQAIRSKDYTHAGEVKRRQEQLEHKIDKIRKEQEKHRGAKELQVTENEIAAVIADWTKIPVQKLQEEEMERLRHLEEILHERVVGQEEAVSAVSKAVRRGRVGLKDPRRPIGSFLFLGPTGVGKTELSKALAEAVFGKENDIIRVDMSEYMEKHSVSKMIGSPPGYVGYEDGGQLSEKVRRHPYSVILFDEIEKAHADVFNILLQILEDGHVTDAQGRKVSFKNTIIIMTSNAGAQRIIEPRHLGFGVQEDAEADYHKMKDSVMEEVKKIFKPEFINRIDEILVFHTLTKENIEQIVRIMLNTLNKRTTAQMNLTMEVTEEAVAHLAESGFDKNYGARPVRRAIQTQLEDALADALLDGTIAAGDKIKVDCKDKKIIFSKL